jgi:hypothetical protein
MFSNTLGNPGTNEYATFGGQDAVEKKSNQRQRVPIQTGGMNNVR